MKSGAGKRKGGAYERKIAPIIGQWWFGNPDACWRGQSSGARKTFRNELDIDVGDIVPVKGGFWPWGIETKTRKSWSFGQLFTLAEKSPLMTWYSEIYNKASLNQCHAILIVTGPWEPDYVVFALSIFKNPQEFLGLLNDRAFPYVLFKTSHIIMVLQDFITINRQSFEERIVQFSNCNDVEEIDTR
jgi:hypothetical protein